ncbi:hypothetical protein BEP19_00225 [Ammoniphilus oxalaticus]|uniref:Uncharacterized protein n=1 Tax=Ammoniphilus oxalaticus TaxID=66863 RepID=A0A419SRM1_9BACL|nr:hypothetical protein BEP19_00225 [Ammoniphilus oxalaticus]
MLENIYQISGLALLICVIYYYYHFRKTRKQRKLIGIEHLVYIVTQIAIFLWASSSLLLLLDKGN